jgi:hypothetical protein
VAKTNLMQEIERGALDASIPLADTLRKCVILGGKSGSEKLRDWASHELQGYQSDELPPYRTIPAPLKIDGINPGAQITGQQISPHALPDPADKHIREEVELRFGVGEVEAMLDRDSTKPINLQPAGASQIVSLMNHENDDPFQTVTALYWSVSPTAIRGVLDQIRTSLTMLVAEIRAATPDGDEIPSQTAADQAVNVVVTGKRSRVSVNAAQAAGGSTAKAKTAAPPGDERPFWTWRTIGAVAVGLATIASAVIAFTTDVL